MSPALAPFSHFASSARIFKAFADEKRLAILSILKQGELCVCELTEQLQLGQSALSYHLKILLVSKIIKAREKGKWTFYSIDEEARITISEHLLDLTRLCSIAHGSPDHDSSEYCT